LVNGHEAGTKISDVKGRGHALTLHREDIFAGHLSCTDVGSRIMPELRRFKQPPNQWEFQDPKMEVLYYIRPYFMGIFPYIGLGKW